MQNYILNPLGWPEAVAQRLTAQRKRCGYRYGPGPEHWGIIPIPSQGTEEEEVYQPSSVEVESSLLSPTEITDCWFGNVKSFCEY
jgi:hypothetical protein